MSSLANQQQNLSFPGLLQVPGGITSTLQQVQDGNGNLTALSISSSGSNIATASNFIATKGGTAITGVVSRLISDGFGDVLSLKDFGAVGDGVTDDTAALSAFFAASPGNLCILPAGTYKITSLISKALTNCQFVGVQGQTIITGSFGYAIFNMLASSNVSFSGITFQTTYTNATQDGGTAVFYSKDVSLSNIYFDKCTFTSPNANGNGLIIYLNTATGNSNICTDLIIENCTFINCGRQGTTFMNRSTQANSETFFKGLRFNNNLGKNLGLNGNFGMLISLDGVGEDFTVNNNRLENFYDIGIECVGWKDGEIVGNTFDLMSRLTKPIALSPGGVTNTLPVNVSVLRNKCLSAAKSNSYFVQSSNCLIQDNYFWTDGADQAVFVRSSTNNIFQKNYYKNTRPTAARYGCLYEDSYATGCYGNKSIDEIFDTASGTGGTSALRYFGSSTVTKNVAYRPTFLRTTGVYCDNSTGAINNLVVNASESLSNIFNLDYLTQNFTTDADMEPGLQYYSCAIIRITNSSLTVGRNVIMPSIIKQYVVSNATGQTLTYKAATGTGIAVASLKTAVLFWNGTNMIRVTADT